MEKEVIKSLEWRYAVQVFDPEKKVSQEDLRTVLESGRLAVSSYGFEPWKFFVVENPAVRLRLREAAYGQAKVSEASHLIVLARRTDVRQRIVEERIARTAKTLGVDEGTLGDFERMLRGSIERQDDNALDADMKAQVYIALGTMVVTASVLGIDTAPMGGFDPAAFDDILGLSEQHLSATVLLALGYRGDDDAAKRPKVRRTFEEVVQFVK